MSGKTSVSMTSLNKIWTQMINDFILQSRHCGSQQSFLIPCISLWQALAVGETEWFCSTTLSFPHTRALAILFYHLSYHMQSEHDKAIPVKQEQVCLPL